jgi:hypothetical protein
VVDQRGAPVDGWRARDAIGAGVLGQPALIDAGRRRALVATAEHGDLACVNRGLQGNAPGSLVCGRDSVKMTALRAAPMAPHALEALVQRRQQRMGLLVFTDVACQAQVLVQFGQFLAHQGVVHWRANHRRAWLAGSASSSRSSSRSSSSMSCWIHSSSMVCLSSRRCRRVRMACSVATTASVDDASSLRRMSPNEVLLPAGKAVAEIALQVGRDQFIELNFFFGRRERRGERVALGVRHVLQHVAPQGALDERLQSPAQ